MNEIYKNKPYRYIGGGKGNGEIHFVTSLGGQITTWSFDRSSMTWLGTAEDFRKQFEEVVE